MTAAEKYVAAAYLVVFATVLAYVMYRAELSGKRTDANLRALREALAS